MERAQLKAMAKEQIKGNIGVLFLISLIHALVSYAVNGIPGIGSIVSLVVAPALTLAMVSIYLNLTYGNKPEISELFSKFDQLVPALVANLLIGLFTFLWSLLLIIPGIVKSISYSMTFYIMAENPGISATEAIDRSKAMMDGHKMDYFILSLSFIGWYLLVGITFGIAGIWVMPYVQATQANFYNSIK